MEPLQQELDGLLARLPDADQIRSWLETLVSVYPFNEYEFIISHLLAKEVLSLDQYLEMRDNYIARNMYLYIFEISAPRTFGEAWAQGHLKELVPELVKSTKKLVSKGASKPATCGRLKTSQCFVASEPRVNPTTTELFHHSARVQRLFIAVATALDLPATERG